MNLEAAIMDQLRHETRRTERLMAGALVLLFVSALIGMVVVANQRNDSVTAQEMRQQITERADQIYNELLTVERRLDFCLKEQQ